MKRSTLIIAAVWAISLVIVSASSAVAVTKITGRSVEDSSLTGADIRNGSVTTGDLSLAARQALRGPVVVHETWTIEGNVIDTIDCPSGTVAVNGGVEDDRISPTVLVSEPEDGGWLLHLNDIDEAHPVDVFAVCA